MSNVITNLKVRFGADSSKFQKGMNEGKQSMKDFKKKGSGFFKEFAQAFGVNIDAIQEKTQAFNSGLATMQTGMKGAAGGSGILTKALKFLKVAMVSTGIGALVAALGSLVAYFTKTKKGSDMLKRAMDAIGAVFDVIVDRASDLGEAIVNAFKNPKKAVNDLWEFIKSQFVNRIAAMPKLIESAWNIVKGIFEGGTKEAAKEFASAMTQLTTGLDENQQKKVANGIKGIGKEMANEARTAAQLRKQLQELEEEEIRLIEINSEREKSIEDLRRKSKKLRDKDIEESRDALKRAMAIEQQRLNDELRIARERARIMEEQQALGKNMREDDRALAEAKAKVNQLETKSLKLRRTMTSEMQTLNREYKKQQQQIRENEMAIYDQIEAAGKLQSTGGKVDAGSIDTTTMAPMPEIDTSALEESAGQARAIFENLHNEINNTMSSLVTGFAENFGAMMTGASGLADFGSFVMNTLANLAINVGKTAIATGIAVAGIKKALQSLNPVVAIAGGAALVALGTFVKSSLSNAAGGGGGNASLSSASSVGGSGTNTFKPSSLTKDAQKEQNINVRVRGQLKGEGSELKGVIEEAEYERDLRT